MYTLFSQYNILLLWMAIRPFSAKIMVKFTMGKLACQAYS